MVLQDFFADPFHVETRTHLSMDSTLRFKRLNLVIHLFAVVEDPLKVLLVWLQEMVPFFESDDAGLSILQNFENLFSSEIAHQ